MALLVILRLPARDFEMRPRYLSGYSLRHHVLASASIEPQCVLASAPWAKMASPSDAIGGPHQHPANRIIALPNYYERFLSPRHLRSRSRRLLLAIAVHGSSQRPRSGLRLSLHELASPSSHASNRQTRCDSRIARSYLYIICRRSRGSSCCSNRGASFFKSDSFERDITAPQVRP